MITEQINQFHPELLKQLIASAQKGALRFTVEVLEGNELRSAEYQKIICNTLDRVVAGEIKRLIINIPPGYGKTLNAVWAFIARGFVINPQSRFIHTSYSQELALDNSAKVKEILLSEAWQYFNPLTLRDDTKAKGLWRTDAGGGMRAVQAGGGITGFRAGQMQEGFSGAFIIDDPLKPDDARSRLKVRQINERYNTTIASRLAHEDVPIILIMQRLVKFEAVEAVESGDMSEFLLRGGSGEHWHHLMLPLEIDNSFEYPKEWTHSKPIPHKLPDGVLWDFKHTKADAERLSRANGFVYAAQYLQQPKEHGGAGIFEAYQLQVVDALPSGKIEWVRGWDFASTVDGDYTAGAKLGKLQDGRFIIADMVRLKALADKRDLAFVNATQLDGKTVRVSIPQDPGQAGKSQTYYLTKQIAGYRVHSSPETGDKITRAEPFASQVNIGNVLLLRGAWNEALVQEMNSFPNGLNDDQIDALSRAFDLLMTAQTPIAPVPIAL